MMRFIAMRGVLPCIALLCILASADLHAQPIVVERLSDACPDTCDGFRPDIDNYAVGKTRVYFVGRDSSNFNLDRPWVSDGTPGGTFPLARIATDGYGVGLSSMVTVGDVLYFSARTAASGDWADSRRLWRSDGTPGGTLPVDFPIATPKQLIPRYDYEGIHALSRGVVYPTNLGIWWVAVDAAPPRKLADGYMVGAPAELNGAIYFLETPCGWLCPPGTTAMLRRYDGNGVTSLGPFPVAVTGPGDPSAELAATPAGLFMTTPQTLWTSDGATPPHLLREWIPPAFAYLDDPSLVKTQLLLHVYPGTGALIELWTSDGTVAGTGAITSFGAGPGASVRPLGIAGTATLLAVESTGGYGSGYPDVPAGYPRYSELAVLDGAYPTGTRALRTLASGNGTAPPTYSVGFDGGVMFSAGRLWYTDGTAGGTQFVDPGVLSGIGLGTLLGSIGRTLFFAGSQQATGKELYRLTLPPGYPMTFATAEVTEYYHAGFDHYFMTGNSDEKASLDSGTTRGWVRTGFGFTAYAAGSGAPGISPVCRFYGRPAAGLDSHFYSASPQECAEVVAKFSHAWVYESPDVFEVALPDATGRCGVAQAPIYRALNGRPDVNHRYSVHSVDQKAMQTKGWQPEGMTSAGLVMCALAAQRP